MGVWAVRLLDKSFRQDLFFKQVGGAKVRMLVADVGVLLADPSRPRHATPLPAVEHLFEHAARLADTRVVLISDCDAPSVTERLTMKPLPEIWGVGGLQRLLPNGQCELVTFEERGLQGLAEADDWAEQAGLGAWLVQKPGAVAVHFTSFIERAGEVAAWLRGQVSQRWSEIAQEYDLRLRHFEYGIELRVAIRERADIVRILLAEIGVDTPVAYLGTSLADEFAYYALRDRGFSILVREQFCATLADAWVEPGPGVVRFLERWLRACGATLSLRRCC